MHPEDRREPSSIDDLLGEDHRQLGVALDQLRAELSAASSGASRLLQQFSRALGRHMDWEEQLLFPAVAAKATAAERRSIESLEIDHERLRETLAQLQSSVSSADYVTARTQVDWLETLLRGHNYDEEHGVYVEADRYLTPEDRHRLIEAFRSPGGRGSA
jgi:hemerythrin-like domain-containing protein